MPAASSSAERKEAFAKGSPGNTLIGVIKVYRKAMDLVLHVGSVRLSK